MALQDALDALRSKFEAGEGPITVPSWVHQWMHRATNELVASGAAARARKVGDLTPSFTLNDSNGEPVSSDELLKKGPLVISFYRGVWCPYCNIELRSLQSFLPQIRSHGAHLIAISPQTPANSRRSQRENAIEFPILSDPSNSIAGEFGLRYKLPDYLIDVYTEVFRNDLTIINGDPSWTLPMPARYVVRQDGMIAYAEVNPDYTRRPDPTELLPVLERISSEVN
ncbi:peroxiredoxin-like family protein [Microvirga guangxiensis]|uniref:thioredoxin-dependent peroxiredoxin n=1 Tax=Microvirga guangxiensis TaxID=549386 RepID=A0A1G5KLM0_9HYPH|nr:peroxiredoxin-like family protein [Microvirga guangxiensis]SCZ00950.1 Peroxiredoxin [Microvirga guangxiensis]